MKTKLIIGLLLAIFLTVAGFYGLSEFNRHNKNISEVKEDYTVDGRHFIHEFDASDSLSDKKYLGKIVVVKSTLKSIDKDEKGFATLILGEGTDSRISIRCALDSLHKADFEGLKEGGDVSVKGLYTGFNADATGLLGSDIQLVRCMVIQKGNNSAMAMGNGQTSKALGENTNGKGF